MKIFLTLSVLCIVFVGLSCSRKSSGNNSNGSPILSSASSPEEVFKANYDALKRKDVEAFKGTFSQGWLRETEELANVDDKRFNEFLLREMMKEPEPGLLPETARANITGDKGQLVVQDEKGSRPHTYKIVKENGTWKLNSY